MQSRRRARGDRGAGSGAALPTALLPNLNPIEQNFAKLKSLLRKAAERTRNGLWNAIRKLLDQFPPVECAKSVAHAHRRNSRPRSVEHPRAIRIL